MKKKCLILALCFTGFCSTFLHAQIKKHVNHSLLFADDFPVKLDSSIWIAEIENKPDSHVFVKNRKLVLDTRGGVTVWLNKALEGSYQIEFTRKVILGKGGNDRLSDLNVFWQAKDPQNTNLFTRKGKFEEYDSLRLYYVGMGGNYNSTTRFRKYDGKGERLLLKEYTDSLHLLQANKTYRIKIIVKENETSFWVDDQCFFTNTEAGFNKTGYFGFRSTFSHQEIGEFRVLKYDDHE
ncbi:rhamnogalacturonan endolyase [Pseudarcicella hirudinis]|uniref:Rhamnogalacturonan endolyase n=1 Tax=Pseudarcicella hirudinis TaxID=1079859 RepID=A0A1I5US14_9BACT|nr:DUF6250 domain-containing protein [Pseudarcicella hirudinis]SFP98084.1 rhamnogalacturonan endolyase [Pseudarcicella hirudinis]